MIEGKTASGFAYVITDERLDNYDLLKNWKAWVEGNRFAFYDFPALLLGEDGAKALEEHCRVDGRISTKAIEQEISEIIQAKPLKN